MSTIILYILELFLRICSMYLIFLFFSVHSSCDLDLGFILDESGSIQSRDFKKSIDFVESVSNQFTIGAYNTRVSIISFSDNPILHFEFRDYYGYSKQGLEYYLPKIRQRGRLTCLTFSKQFNGKINM